MDDPTHKSVAHVAALNAVKEALQTYEAAEQTYEAAEHIANETKYEAETANRIAEDAQYEADVAYDNWIAVTGALNALYANDMKLS